jgi:hypothetical protein
MQVPDTASAALSTTGLSCGATARPPAPGEHQIGLSRTLSASSGAVTVSGPPSMTRSMNSVRLARPRTSRTDIPYMGTGLYGFSSSGAVARSRRLSRPAGGAVLPCRDGRHRIVSYNVTISGGSAMAATVP